MQLIMYITLLNSQVYLCLGGRLIHLKVFLVWKLVIWSTLVSLGQYVHFPNLVHTVLKAIFCLVSSTMLLEMSELEKLITLELKLYLNKL